VPGWGGVGGWGGHFRGVGEGMWVGGERDEVGVLWM
jgi:hypothetical protein